MCKVKNRFNQTPVIDSHPLGTFFSGEKFLLDFFIGSVNMGFESVYQKEYSNIVAIRLVLQMVIH